MTEDIVRPKPPSASDRLPTTFRPDELNADLAAATLAKDLMNKLPTPSIDTRKFTIIHGLMKSLNHIDGKNPTYIDTSLLVSLMDRVSEASVNVDGTLLNSIFAYLMKPKYIIQGMPSAPNAAEEKPGILQRLFGWGKSTQQQGGAPK